MKQQYEKKKKKITGITRRIKRNELSNIKISRAMIIIILTPRVNPAKEKEEETADRYHSRMCMHVGTKRLHGTLIFKKSMCHTLIVKYKIVPII